MVERFNNSKRTKAGPVRRSLVLASAILQAALLASTPFAVGQKAIVQFLPQPGRSTSASSATTHSQPAQPLAGAPNGPVPGATGYYIGTAAVNGTSTQQMTLEFLTYSNLSTFVPTVSLRYGISYSAGAANCIWSANPNYSAGTTSQAQYPYLETCTVTITFKPLYPGGHKDALFVLGADGKTQIGGEFLYGIGLAPQLMIQPGITTTLTPAGGAYLYGATADEAGTYYVWGNNTVYTIHNGVSAPFLTSFPQSTSLSIDGAGNLFSNYTSNGSWTALEYETASNTTRYPDLTWTTIEEPSDNIVAYTTLFDNPNSVAAGNLGIFYDADGGGEYENASYSERYSDGLIPQSYDTQDVVVSPGPIAMAGNLVPPFGDQPIGYPLQNYAATGMVVDSYENLFFMNAENGLAVWCDWGEAVLGDGVSGLNSKITGSTTGCAGWGSNMVALTSQSGSYVMAADAADTLYFGLTNVQMYASSNNYASAIADIGVPGYAGATTMAPDGTLYVVTGNSTVSIVDRSQGSINFGSNNGSTSNPYTVTLYNGGNQPLTLGSITLAGDGYSLVTPAATPCSAGLVVAVGGYCLFQVRSNPPHGGTLNGSVTIVSNSLNDASATQTITLTGYTSGIYVTPSPNPLNFGFVKPSQSSTLPVSLINTSVGSNSIGYGSSTVINGSLTSSNPAYTASQGNCNVAEAAGGTPCQIQITFNPALAQSYSGTISWTEAISGGGPTMPVTLTVNGTGINPIVPLPDTEGVHLTDQVTIIPSTLLSINEVVDLSDNSPALVASTLLPIDEVLQLSDAPSLTSAGPFATSTQLTASASVVQTGGTVSLTAAVTPVGTTLAAAGQVSFYEDGSLLGSSSLLSGVATYPSPALSTGTHTFAAKFAANPTFNASNSSNVTVTATTATVLTVSAQSVTRGFAVSNPAFTYTVSGFTNGDTSTVLTGAPAFTTTAALNSAASVYPLSISAGTLAAPTRYAFNFVPGTITVTGGATQVISSTSIPTLPLSLVPQITLAAYSTSGLPITYTASGPATVSGSTVLLTGTGVVTITATQKGNTTFAPATPVSQSFTVAP